MKNTYLIKLFPLEPFFFGGEKTFDSGDEANYFIRSNYFPQQTALLGLLRYQLLKQNNKLNQQDMTLIGPESFNSELEEQDFGKIKKLSPVFISNTLEENYFPLSFDYCYADNNESIVPIKYSNNANGKVKLSFPNHGLPIYENYKMKNEIAKVLINSSGGNYKLFDFDIQKKINSTNGIFIKESRIGIYKKQKIEAEEDAFYKQEYLNLVKDFCFAFFLESDEEIRNDLVWFGKERTYFNMVVYHKPELSFEKICNHKPFEYLRKERDWSSLIILTSDAYVLNDIYDECNAAITEVEDFRNIQTPTNVQNFGALDQRINSAFRYKSQKYNLLKRGSVLYGNVPELINYLRNDNFKKIGYNYYITEKSLL